MYAIGGAYGISRTWRLWRIGIDNSVLDSAIRLRLRLVSSGVNVRFALCNSFVDCVVLSNRACSAQIKARLQVIVSYFMYKGKAVFSSTRG